MNQHLEGEDGQGRIYKQLAAISSPDLLFAEDDRVRASNS